MKTLKFVLVAVLLSAGSSRGDSVIYQFQPIIANAFPGGSTPQIEATFKDITPGKILLTITTSGLVKGEFLSDLYFNFDPAEKVKRLRFTQLSSPSGSVFSKTSTGDNSFRINSYGDYDIHLNFNGASRKNHFGNGVVTCRISGPGLDASDFVFLDSSGNCKGLYYTLACVRNTCGNNVWFDCSSYQSVKPVPEPASINLLVFAAGMSSCFYLWVKRTKPTRT